MKKITYTDPTIGTVGDVKTTSIHGGGKTHPGACTPGGLVQLSPDTVTGGDNGTGYNYCDTTIEGFSFTHLSGIGWYGDLGCLQIMPTVGETPLRSGTNEFFPSQSEGWCSEFSHESESAHAGYYSVKLDRYGIFAEATATPHVGYLRLHYPESSDARLIFNLPRRIGGRADLERLRVVSETRVEGEIVCSPKGGGFGHGAGGIGFTLYFVCELSKPMKSRFFFTDETRLSEQCELSGEDVGFSASFDGGELTVKAAISYVDLDGARNNLAVEGTDFASALESTEAAWERELSRIEVEGSDATDLTLFYTCLYHALLDPRSGVDCDGRYSLDGEIRRAEDFTFRTVFSGWDVYRSEFPLLTLLKPSVVSDEISSLELIADKAGTSHPRWELMGRDSGCMLGDPAVIVAADAYLKGIKGFDAMKICERALAGAFGAQELHGKPFRPLRKHAKKALERGFQPGSLSETLEEGFADYALSRLAESLGLTDEARTLRERSMRYGESYNPALGFLVPRNEDGSFIKVADEYSEVGCTESNILQQSFFVPHDVAGLAELYGRERFIALLEEFFEKADLTALWNVNYNHSNEPCHNVSHYFAMLGLPERTQYWTRRIQKEAYRLGAYGFCGNEDVGQLSAWYVLSAMGFAQVCPSRDELWLNTPLFRRVELRLDPLHHSRELSASFVVECDRDPLEYPYIREARLNGVTLGRDFLRCGEITAGGRLELTMSASPEGNCI